MAAADADARHVLHQRPRRLRHGDRRPELFPPRRRAADRHLRAAAGQRHGLVPAPGGAVLHPRRHDHELCRHHPPADGAGRRAGRPLGRRARPGQHHPRDADGRPLGVRQCRRRDAVEDARPRDGEARLCAGLRRRGHRLGRGHHADHPARHRAHHLRLPGRRLDRPPLHRRRRARHPALRRADAGHGLRLAPARLPSEPGQVRERCGARPRLPGRHLGADHPGLHPRRHPLRHLHADRGRGDDGRLRSPGRPRRPPRAGASAPAGDHRRDRAGDEHGDADHLRRLRLRLLHGLGAHPAPGSPNG